MLIKAGVALSPILGAALSPTPWRHPCRHPNGIFLKPYSLYHIEKNKKESHSSPYIYTTHAGLLKLGSVAAKFGTSTYLFLIVIYFSSFVSLVILIRLVLVRELI